MDLFDAIESRASVRALQPADVSEADLERILTAGRRAPSGRNVQPIEFIVVRDRKSIDTLAQVQACLGDVDLIVCVAAHPDRSAYWLEDAAAATTQMLLAITALGYASVWIEGTLLQKQAELKPALGLPEEMRLVVALPIGKPVQPVTPREKRALTDIVHWEKYGAKR
jgi:nitroreductase